MRLPARASKALLPRLTTADPGPQLDLFYSALGFATRPAARGPPGGPSELTRLAAYLRGTPAPPAGLRFSASPPLSARANAVGLVCCH